MVRHFNPSISEDCLELFNTKTGEGISQDIEENIVPVIEIEPNADIIRDTVSLGADTTIYTTPTDNDFYLRSVVLSFTCDNTSDATNCYVDCVDISGTPTTRRQLIPANKMTLTAIDSKTISITFGKRGIKLKRNSTIRVGSNNTVGNIILRGSITGYTRRSKYGYS